jgi:hypothetical protein
MINLQKAFEKASDADEYLEFDRIQNPLHRRRDIAAFLLLDKLVPSGSDAIVQGADHDVIWLDTNIDKLAKVATEEDILYLYRCGVCLNTDVDCLEMCV